MKVIGFVTILLAMCKYIECDNVPQQQPLFCSDLKPQNQVDIDQVRVDFDTFLLFVLRKSIFLPFCLSHSSMSLN